MARGFKKGHPTYNNGKIAIMDDPEFQKLWKACHFDKTISQVKAAKACGLSIPTFMKYSELYAQRVIIEGCMQDPNFRQHVDEIRDKCNITNTEDIKAKYGM